MLSHSFMLLDYLGQNPSPSILTSPPHPTPLFFFIKPAAIYTPVMASGFFWWWW